MGKIVCYLTKCYLFDNHQDEEAYVCIYSHRSADTILFYHQGGVDIGDVDSKALKLDVPVGKTVTADDIKKQLLTHLTADKKVNNQFKTMWHLEIDVNYYFAFVNR